MKTIATWIDTLPSPLRHAVIALAVLELGIVANAFIGVASWQDVRAAVIALPVAAVAAAARYVQEQIAGSKP